MKNKGVEVCSQPGFGNLTRRRLLEECMYRRIIEEKEKERKREREKEKEILEMRLLKKKQR